MGNKTLLYFADPMCSWCWGFSPVIHQLAQHYCDDADLQIHLGGLRAGNTQVMDSEQRLYILNHWFNVNEASQQPFDFSFNMPEGFIYDTEPACRAVKTMQQLNETQALAYFSDIQQAFYAENSNVTQPQILCDLALKHEVTEEQFESSFNSEITKQLTQKDFILSKQLGVNGFPSVIGKKGDHYMYITQGFQLYERIESAINQWLND